MKTLNQSTKKLLQALLGKAGINISGLVEILEKTENPELAIELLLGDYKQPDIPKKSMVTVDYNDADKVEAIFEKYDKWDDRVHYTFQWVEQRIRYVPASVDQATVTFDNINQLGTSYGPGIRTVRQHPEGKIVDRKDYMTLERWLNGAGVKTDEDRSSENTF